MISLIDCRAVIILCLLGSFRCQTFANSLEGNRLDSFLKKRDIGSLGKDVDEVIRASPDPTSRSQDELNDTHSPVAPPYRGAFSSENTTYSHEGRRATLPSTTIGLSSMRRSSIQKALTRHKDEMIGMDTEFQELSTMLEFLVDHKELLRFYGQVAADKTIEEILEGLEIFHKSVLQLVQHNLRKWGGLDGFGIGEKHESEEGMCVQKPEGSTPSEDPKFESREETNRSLGPSRKCKRPQEPQFGGHVALFTVIRENVEAQKKASIEIPSSHQFPPLIQHGRELRNQPVEVISEKLQNVNVSQLSKLLQSITFAPHSGKLDSLQLKGRGRRRIKSCFQTFVFQEIQYMYKFELISKENLRHFFDENNIQEITGIHLVDHFDVCYSSFYRNFTFVPDSNFIKTHWHTKHLHISLKALEERQQALVFYTAIKIMVEVLYDLEAYYENDSERHQRFIIEESFASKLRLWQKNKNYTESSLFDMDIKLHKQLMVILEMFQSPTPVDNLEDPLILERSTYLVDYYILKFIQSHNLNILCQIFPTTLEYEKFKTQLKLLEVGLEIHQILNLPIDYRDYLHLPYENGLTCPDEVQNSKKGETYENLKILSGVYMSLWHEISGMSKSDPKIDNWMKGKTVSRDIIDFLTSEAKSLQESSNSEELKINPTYRNLWLY